MRIREGFAMASFWRDIRFGLRMLRQAPGHSAAAAIALSLGIGLTTAVFSIVYGAVFRGMPFEQCDRLMLLETQNPARDLVNQPVDVHDLLDWRRRQNSFEQLAGFSQGTVTVSGDDKPERLDGANLTAEALDLLRVKPLLGHGFQRGDDRPGAPPVVLLGYRLWKSHYDGDPAIVGRGVRVNGQQATVIGVMPPDFAFPFTEQLWAPLTLDPGKAERGKGTAMAVFGRLRSGVTRDRATAELAAIAHALGAEYPRTNAGWSVSISPITDRAIGKPVRLVLLTMLGAVACVLLIACINVASLTTSRASQRTREVAIRSALGAVRGQIIRQILTESLLLAILGAAGGLALAWEGIHLFNEAILNRAALRAGCTSASTCRPSSSRSAPLSQRR
jgi:putative ABC transport system permease protein